MRNLPIAIRSIIFILSIMSSTRNLEAGPWIADMGDGNYRNPILYADYSDPDAVRVGDDYWMTSSSFGHVPGLPILHSRDLVNWELVNHAMPRLVPEDHFALPRHGNGVWAPAFRHHGGKFWIFYGDPDFGICLVTASDPAGEWSEPHLLKQGKGLIDPCPIWDDDGKAYLVHAWAKSRAGFNNVLTLHQMSPDGREVLDAGKVIIDGNKLPGWRTIEGPKFYKRDGWYWIFAPAGGVAEGYQAVFRSRDIEGPYEERIVLEQGPTEVNGPHQGAWVDTPSGQHWFLHFQEKLPYGRIVHLQPMQWSADGWPVMGADPDGDGTGNPVTVSRKPDLPEQTVSWPPSTDTFDGDSIGLQWQWQANPSPDWSSLSSHPGKLLLNCVPNREKSHWMAAHLLMQKFAAPAFEVTTRISLQAKQDGDCAGLMVFGYGYRWLGLRQVGDNLHLVLRGCGDTREKSEEIQLVAADAPASEVDLRLSVRDGGLCQFAYRFGTGAFQPIGEPFQAQESKWVGAKVGVFASATGAGSSPGQALVDSFLVR